MLFLARADCRDADELDSVMSRLTDIPDIELYTAGLTVRVTYEPKSSEAVLKCVQVMADITSVIEDVETHGISLRAREDKRGDV